MTEHSALYTQRARKKVQAKKTREIKYIIFFREIAFLAVVNFFHSSKNDFWPLPIFEIAKNGIWSIKFFVKLIYFISRVFLDWTFLKFLAHYVAVDEFMV